MVVVVYRDSCFFEKIGLVIGVSSKDDHLLHVLMEGNLLWFSKCELLSTTSNYCRIFLD